MSKVITYTLGWHFPAVTKSIQFSRKCFSREGKGRLKPLLTASQLGKKLRATRDSTHGKISKCFFYLLCVYLWAWLPDLRPKQNDRVAACICSGSGKTRVSGASACEWRFDGAKPPGDVFCACAHYSLVRSNRRFPGGDRPLGSGWRERQQVTDLSSAYSSPKQPIGDRIAEDEPIGIGASVATM